MRKIFLFAVIFTIFVSTDGSAQSFDSLRNTLICRSWCLELSQIMALKPNDSLYIFTNKGSKKSSDYDCAWGFYLETNGTFTDIGRPVCTSGGIEDFRKSHSGTWSIIADRLVLMYYNTHKPTLQFQLIRITDRSMAARMIYSIKPG